jgi:hypothetical protein
MRKSEAEIPAKAGIRLAAYIKPDPRFRGDFEERSEAARDGRLSITHFHD